MSKSEFPSELRFDVASKDWVVIATGRAKKPDSFKSEEGMERTPEEECPFCDIKSQEPATLILKGDEEVGLDDEWGVVSFPNKYPAFIPSGPAKQETEGGLYTRMGAVGYHEVIVTKDHDKPFGLFNQEEAESLVEAYHSRYLSLMKEDFVNYISIFQNHGPKSGASLYHPHSQLITTPLIDTDLRTALKNSGEYGGEKGECIYCKMMEHEMEVGDRVVFQNDHFLVICPFASKVAFEMIITPKKHASDFSTISQEEKQALGGAFREALGRLHRGLNNPSYNFYLHSAPCDGNEYPFYHWHWTILPKTNVPAGFEMGTEMEISVIEPEKAAEYLRKQ